MKMECLDIWPIRMIRCKLSTRKLTLNACKTHLLMFISTLFEGYFILQLFWKRLYCTNTLIFDIRADECCLLEKSEFVQSAPLAIAKAYAQILSGRLHICWSWSYNGLFMDCYSFYFYTLLRENKITGRWLICWRYTSIKDIC